MAYSEQASRPVYCSHPWDRSCLKYFVISLAPLQLQHARHKYCIGGEFKIMLSPKQLRRRIMCAFMPYKSTPYVFTFERKVGLLYFRFAVISQEAAAKALRRKSIAKLPGQCLLYFQRISRTLPSFRTLMLKGSRVKQTCVWPPIGCLTRL